ncbi:hypothetical protein CIG2463D_0971 [Campylobacter iguaniorum]|uniref:hypothetical protein n=1 Tax=Campylobacter iguaniorum TaxID=1244531 RepID=UPI00073A4CDA|nr:hypothetical protein [Campylobacter iguaniorum]ALV24544.1 hypothetical protein CIG2463D_0971 [Campylobacter iguaniorum]
MQLNDEELRIYNVGLLRDKEMRLNNTRSDIYALKLKLTDVLNEPMDLQRFENITKEIIFKIKLKNKLVFEIENLKQ